MTKLFQGSLFEDTERILCCYVNGTAQILIARITNIPNWHFERVVFPKERFLFEAPPTAQLEIHRNTKAGTTLSDCLPCSYLRVSQVGSDSSDMELSTIICGRRISCDKIA